MTAVARTEFVFIDECGINLWTRRTRGRARRGCTAIRIVNGRRGRNVTVTFSVSNRHGLVNSMIMAGGMTADVFNNFITETAERYSNNLLLDGNSASFIFDNAPANVRAAQVHLPEDCEARFLPPYSPFLNITENAFSIFKAYLKQGLANIRHNLLWPRSQTWHSKIFNSLLQKI